MEKFANYGFNKSHAAAYALVSYQTAWLKAHHPVAFLAASMSLDMDKTDKLASHMQEAARLGSRSCRPTSTEAPSTSPSRATRRSASPWPPSSASASAR
jgi:DNA polymerase III alpha subunit